MDILRKFDKVKAAFVSGRGWWFRRKLSAAEWRRVRDAVIAGLDGELGGERERYEQDWRMLRDIFGSEVYSM